MIKCRDCKWWRGYGSCECERIEIITHLERERIVDKHASNDGKTIYTKPRFGCIYGEEPNPQCPSCDTEADDYSDYMDMYPCPNGDCRVRWFEEDTQCTQ